MLAPLFIIVCLGLCYAVTIAPDLTWAHFSADGGDLISAAASGGVPHPGGYPLYLILARPFQMLPFGSLAFRTNLFSAVVTSLAALVLYSFLLSQFQPRWGARLSASLGALAYGLAPLVWGQALVTEVYALHGLLVAGCLLVWSLDQARLNEWSRGFVLGMAVANHLTALLVLPLSLLNIRGKLLVPKRVFLARCLGILSGLALYLLLPLLAYFNPPVNWGNAASLKGFAWLVSGQIYTRYLSGLAIAELVVRLRACAGLLLEQFGWAGVLLGLYGLFSLKPAAVRLATLWLAGAFVCFALLYATQDSQVYLMACWLVFAIWIAYGAQDLFDLLTGHFRMQAVLGALLLAGLLARVPQTLRQVDLSTDYQARDFIDQTLAKIPRDALISVTGDEQLFSLWYAQYGLRRRMDITIVASGLVSYRWYLDGLKHTYPTLNIPAGDYLEVNDLINANLRRVICYISAGQPVVCSKPLSK